MKYPVGIQSYESLRRDDYVYVDKTALIYQLVTTGRYYYLSRPRRFGKSLLISTLQAYFEGKRELFEGLAIADLEKEWTCRPVLHLDMNTEKFDELESLRRVLDTGLYLRHGAEARRHGGGCPSADRREGVCPPLRRRLANALQDRHQLLDEDPPHGGLARCTIT